jgi:hypothetical protein
MNLEAAIARQPHLIAEFRNQVEAATVVLARVGEQLRVEGTGIEGPALVFDRDLHLTVCEGHKKLDLLGRAAVADGVGAGLLDRQDDIVDDRLVQAVLDEVVTDALAGAQEA